MTTEESKRRDEIRAYIRRLLVEMRTAERKGQDAEMLTVACEIVDKAEMLRRHAEDHGL